MADAHARRRRNALGVVAGISLLAGVVVGARADSDGAAKPAPKAIELPGGGRTILPGRRVVAYYGHPGDNALGVLGIGTPAEAGRKLVARASRYGTAGARPLPAMELISTLALSFPGPRGTYSSRLPHGTIRRYLRAARAAGALLILDIQPGRGEFGPEIDHVARYLKEPDVGLALDPEWKVGPAEIPGQVIGSMDAAEINATSARLSRIVRARRLPQKLLLVHQFTPSQIKNNGMLRRFPGVGLAVNVDGFGTRKQKSDKYRELAAMNPHLAHGFKLFFDEDSRDGATLMQPRQALKLRPRPSVIVYE